MSDDHPVTESQLPAIKFSQCEVVAARPVRIEIEADPKALAELRKCLAAAKIELDLMPYPRIRQMFWFERVGKSVDGEVVVKK